MEQLPPGIEQLLTDLESPNPAVRQAAATGLGQLSTSDQRIVAALEKAASAGGNLYDGSAQAATAAATALLAPAHRNVLAQMGLTIPVQSLSFVERRKPFYPSEMILSDALANVMDRYVRKNFSGSSGTELGFIVEIIMQFTPLSNIYYVKLKFGAAEMEGTNKTILLEAQVKKGIY